MSKQSFNQLQLVEMLQSNNSRQHTLAFNFMAKSPKYFGSIRGFIRKRGGDIYEVQEVFNRAWMQLKEMLSTGQVGQQEFKLQSLPGLFFVLAKRQWGRILNSRKPSDELDETNEDLLDFQPNINDEKYAHLRSLLNRLSKKDRTILVLYYFENWALEAIAKEMGYARIQGVSNRKRVALNQLKEWYQVA